MPNLSPIGYNGEQSRQITKSKALMDDSDKAAHETDEIEQRILKAAAKLILHYGYDKTTVNDIAREAGIAKSTLYLRWKKKDDLLAALIWHESRCYLDSWLARMEADPEGGTFSSVYRNILLAMSDSDFLTQFYNRDRQVMNAFMARMGLGDLFAQRNTMMETFMKLLQDVGTIRADLDVAAVAFVSNCMQYGLIKINDIVPEEQMPEIEVIVQVMVEMLQAYLTPPNGGNPEAGKQIIRQTVAEIRAWFDQLEQQTG